VVPIVSGKKRLRKDKQQQSDKRVGVKCIPLYATNCKCLLAVAVTTRWGMPATDCSRADWNYTSTLDERKHRDAGRLIGRQATT
jgi:hypothetical protein